MERVKVIVYSQSLAQPPVMQTLVQQLESQKATVESQFVRTPEEITAAVEATALTVLILTLQTKEELVDLLNVLSQVEERIRNGFLRTLILNGVNHPRVISLMKAKGAHDIIDFNCTIKSLNHKIKTAFLVVTQNYQRQNAQQKGRGMGSEAAAPIRESRNEPAQTVKWLKPVEHPSDIWFVPSVKNFRPLMGRWLIDLLGPGPSAGFWEETKLERNGEKGWVWKVRVAPDSVFQPRSGRWMFFGRQPEFSWQKNLWSFVSSAPFLAFYAGEDQAPEYARITWNPGKELEAYENSEVSKAFVPKIQASLEISMKASKSEADGAAYGNVGGAMHPASETPGYVSSGEAPAPEWNEHDESVGFQFRAKDLRIAKPSTSKRPQNPLAPDAKLGMNLGLTDVQTPGLKGGKGSFEKIVLEILVEARNGISPQTAHPLRILELTSEQGAFEFPKNTLEVKDRLRLGIRFRYGETERNFSVDWNGYAIQGVDGAGLLAYGSFSGKGQEDLRQALQLFDRREGELKDFFSSARGV